MSLLRLLDDQNSSRVIIASDAVSKGVRSMRKNGILMTWVSSISVGMRLALSFGFLGLSVALLGTMVWFTGQTTTSQSRALIDELLPIERSVREWRTYSIKLGEMTLRASTSQDVFPLTVEISKLSQTSNELVQDLVARVQGSSKRDAFSSTMESAMGVMTQYLTLRDQLVQDALEGKIISQRQKSEHEQALTDYMKALDEMLILSERLAREAGVQMIAGSQRSQSVSAIAVFFVLLLSALSGWFIRRSIVHPLAVASSAVSQVASGDLTVSVNVHGRDELGQMMTALNQMVASLHHVVSEVRDVAESIHVASSEVASGNLDLSTRTEQAAGNLQETASSLEQLSRMVKNNASNAQQAHDLVNEASAVALEGGEIVRQVVSTMDTIQQSSKRISEIVGIIDGIAFQTNILALNAAVEAARAGEQGRGFAVVASEVRNLASRSANAAKEIKQLIEGSVSNVRTGASLVNTAGTTMNDIVDRVSKVQAIMGEVNAATRQQSQEIGQVVRSVSFLDEMTQQNAALVEQGSAAAMSLKEQASRLHAEMDSFMLNAAR